MNAIVLVDIDGTIALRGDRSPHDHDSAMEDAINWPVVNLLYLLDQPVVLITGRDAKYRDVTEYWLRRHELFPNRHAVLMRDFDDSRPDVVVKRELYEAHIRTRWHVFAVFDDRNSVVKMWRDLGLTCYQVADGNF